MAKYSKGDKIMHATTLQHGVVIDVFPPRRGRQLYRVNWGERENDELESDLKADANTSDPFERIANNIYSTYLDFAKQNTTFKIQNSNNSTISSLKAARTLFRAYQFKPLLKFLNSINRRLLVADEVGLGKTIEAGHIMLELKARGELTNVLIVCPKSLREKWYNELKEKFGLVFEIYEKTEDLIDDLDNKNGAVRGIINYEKIRLKNIDEGSSEEKKKKKRVNDITDYLVENNKRFSLLICDEAHKLRNEDTQQYRGAERLMDCVDSAVFLTATPIMLNSRNLYNILHLLDNVKYYNPQIFDNLLEENKPFVSALTNLNAGVPLPDIADQLTNAEITTQFINEDTGNVVSQETKTANERFCEYPIYQRIIENLRNGKDTHKLRALLQQDISSMSVMNNIFSRTRKREVTMDMSQAERDPHPCIIHLYDDEQEQFDDIIEQYYNDNSYTNYYGEEVISYGAQLGLTQKKRQIASSVYAYLNEDYNLENGTDIFANRPDAKIDKLQEIIQIVFADGQKKIIVFALFRKTLKYLELRLNRIGYRCAIIHGGIKDRAEVLSKFEYDDTIQVLLSSEVGSEGLDMQFCNSMVNYDLPWNPMVVEQRIGRIDRFGQQSPKVHIYNFIVADSIQEEIYTRLLDRIGIFRGTIGDMEAILDARIEIDGRQGRTVQEMYENLEKELYFNKLTKDERERKIREVEQAIENEKNNLKQLEEGLTNSLTNDAYFKDEIQRLLHNNAYVTEKELYNYLYRAIIEEMPTCQLVESQQDSKVYQFIIAPSQPSALKNFLIKYQVQTEEAIIAYKSFRNKIDGKLTFNLTFNQEKAFTDKTLIYINIYHPLIQTCLNCFTHKYDKSVCTFSYSLRHDELLQSGKTYFLTVYRLRTKRLVQGINVNSDTQYPILFDIAQESIVNDEDLTNHILSQSQIYGLQTAEHYENVNKELVQNLRYDLSDTIRSIKERNIKELQLQLQNDQMRELAQLEEWYKSRKKSIEAKIAEYQWNLQWHEETFLDNEDKDTRRRLNQSIAQQRVQLRRLEETKDERYNIITADPNLQIEETLIALNYIRID